MYLAVSICYSMIPHKTQFERYLLEICLTVDILCLKLRPRKGETWPGLHDEYTTVLGLPPTPDILTPLLCSFYYKVQLLLHIFLLPYKTYCLL